MTVFLIFFLHIFIFYYVFHCYLYIHINYKHIIYYNNGMELGLEVTWMAEQEYFLFRSDSTSNMGDMGHNDFWLV